MLVNRRARTRADLVLEALRLGVMPLALVAEDDEGGDDDAGGGGKPGASDGKNKDEKPPRTYTQEELDRKLQGSGKEIDKLKAQLAKHEEAETKRKAAADKKKKEADDAKRKELEEQGNFKALLEEEREERKKLQEQLQGMQETETKRLESVAAENKKRTEKLAKEYRSLIPAGLGPDETRLQIERLEQLQNTNVRDVKHGGRVGPHDKKLEDLDDDAWEERMSNWGQAITMGQTGFEKKEEGKK